MKNYSFRAAAIEPEQFEEAKEEFLLKKVGLSFSYNEDFELSDVDEKKITDELFFYEKSNSDKNDNITKNQLIRDPFLFDVSSSKNQSLDPLFNRIKNSIHSCVDNYEKVTSFVSKPTESGFICNEKVESLQNELRTIQQKDSKDVMFHFQNIENRIQDRLQDIQTTTHKIDLNVIDQIASQEEPIWAKSMETRFLSILEQYKKCETDKDDHNQKQMKELINIVKGIDKTCNDCATHTKFMANQVYLFQEKQNLMDQNLDDIDSTVSNIEKFQTEIVRAARDDIRCLSTRMWKLQKKILKEVKNASAGVEVSNVSLRKINENMQDYELVFKNENIANSNRLHELWERLNEINQIHNDTNMSLKDLIYSNRTHEAKLQDIEIAFNEIKYKK